MDKMQVKESDYTLELEGGNPVVSKYISRLNLLVENKANHLIGNFLFELSQDNVCDSDFDPHTYVNGMHRYQWAYCCVAVMLVLIRNELIPSKAFVDYIIDECYQRWFKKAEVVSMFEGLISDKYIINYYDRNGWKDGRI
jgi:hypothetical protein